MSIKFADNAPRRANLVNFTVIPNPSVKGGIHLNFWYNSECTGTLCFSEETQAQLS